SRLKQTYAHIPPSEIVPDTSVQYSRILSPHGTEARIRKSESVGMEQIEAFDPFAEPKQTELFSHDI
ncbi:hypothetical protein Pmar_PMAR009742, partial [Perkinsus marinus ATCC 50983]